MTELKQDDSIVGLDKSVWKISVIGLIGVLLAGVTGYFLATVLHGETNLMPLLAASGAFFVVFLLQIFFIKSSGIINGLVLADTVLITIPFFSSFSVGLIIAWFVLLLMWLNSVRKGRNELGNQLKIKFSRVEKSVLPSALTAFSLFIAITTVWVNGASLTKERFLILIKPTQPIMQSMLSDSFDFNMTVVKFAEVVIENKAGVNVSALPTVAKNLAINQVLNQVKGQYNLSFKNTDSVSDAIYDYLMSRISLIPERIKGAVPIGAALLVFLTVKGMAYILRYIIIIVAWGLYEFSLVTGFAHKSLESRSHEIVIL